MTATLAVTHVATRTSHYVTELRTCRACGMLRAACVELLSRYVLAIIMCVVFTKDSLVH